MATNDGKFNDDEFLDLEPVLDDDSFSFDLDPPELEEIAVDSLVASSGEGYPEEIESSSMYINDLGTHYHNKNGKKQINNDYNIDLDLEFDEDPLLDKKINEIVDNDSKAIYSNHEDETAIQNNNESIYENLELDEETITLSMDELDNITGTLDDNDSGIEFLNEDEFIETSDTIKNKQNTEFNTGTNNQLSTYTEKELDDILGNELFEPVEEDFSDEPIALSLDELNNIMSDEDTSVQEPVSIEDEFDLDMDSNLESSDDLNLEDFDLDSSILSDEDYSESELDSNDELDLLNESNNIFSDEDIADEELSDEPITLSLEEMSAITSEEDEEIPLPEEQESLELDDLFHDLPEPDEIADFEDFNLGDEDISSEDTDLLTESMVENTSLVKEEKNDEFLLSEEENLTLSDEELGNILGTEDELPLMDSLDSDSIFSSEEDISIIPEDTEESQFGDMLDLDENNLRDNYEFSGESESDSNPESNLESDFDDFDLDRIESEDIGVEEESDIDDKTEEIGGDKSVDFDSEFDSDEIDLELGLDIDLDDDLSDEPITLSSDELNDIIGLVPPGENLELQTKIIEEENFSPSLNTINQEEKEVIDLDEFADDGNLSPLEELRQSPNISNEEEKDISKSDSMIDSSELSSEDKKKVLTYLDNLLGNLPDDLIREFSKSNYFDLYKKMMKEIGL